MLRRILYFIIALVTFTAPALFDATPAAAITGSEWRAGRIIDDSVFTNKNAMSVQEIQYFLNSKLAACDTYAEQVVTYRYPFNTDGAPTVTTTRAVYAERKGNPAPEGRQIITCLKDYYEVPKTTPSPAEVKNNYGYANPLEHIPAGAKSAAALIWEAAQTYGISPKVLLVTLQKEQSLITDDWPLSRQYLYAMGSNCPDGPNGAECSADYAGFSIQMLSGARLFRKYLDNMTQPWWQYEKPYQVNSILWQVPYSNCGAGDVYIETMATAALYTYTPYQPNKAALDNLRGEGDRCSAYGNRNFWRLYNDWFGTTYGSLFQATLLSQSAYPSLAPGETKQVTLKYRNSGLWTWHDGSVDWPGIPPMFLVTDPPNRPNIFSYGWPEPSIISRTFTQVYEADGTTLAANQHLVDPGQVAEFTFPLTAPWSIKINTSYTNYFKPILAGSFIDLGPWAAARMDVNVPPLFQASLLSQSTYPTLGPGESKQVTLRYRNSGLWSWRDEDAQWPSLPPTYLATAQPTNRPSRFGFGWPSASTVAKTFSKVYESDGITLAANQHITQRDQIVEYTFPLSAPWTIDAGAYSEYFRPVMAGSDINMGAASLTRMDVNVPRWRAALVGQSIYPTIPRGDGRMVFIRYRNSGAWTWHDDNISWPGLPPTYLATVAKNTNTLQPSGFAYGWPTASHTSHQFGKVYESDGTTLAANQHLVYPNQIVQFDFPLTTPWSFTTGSYPVYFKPIINGADVDMGGSAAQAELDVNVP